MVCLNSSMRLSMSAEISTFVIPSNALWKESIALSPAASILLPTTITFLFTIFSIILISSSNSPADISTTKRSMWLESSHMVLFVVDISAGEFEEDIRIMENIVNKKVIVVGNKIDAAGDKAIDSFYRAFGGMEKVEISALMDKGIEELRQTIYSAAAGQRFDEFAETVISSARHKLALEQANEAIIKAEETLKDNLSREYIA